MEFYTQFYLPIGNKITNVSETDTIVHVKIDLLLITIHLWSIFFKRTNLDLVITKSAETIPTIAFKQFINSLFNNIGCNAAEIFKN